MSRHHINNPHQPFACLVRTMLTQSPLYLIITSIPSSHSDHIFQHTINQQHTQPHHKRLSTTRITPCPSMDCSTYPSTPKFDTNPHVTTFNEQTTIHDSLHWLCHNNPNDTDFNFSKFQFNVITSPELTSLPSSRKWTSFTGRIYKDSRAFGANAAFSITLIPASAIFGIF